MADPYAALLEGELAALDALVAATSRRLEFLHQQQAAAQDAEAEAVHLADEAHDSVLAEAADRAVRLASDHNGLLALTQQHLEHQVLPQLQNDRHAKQREIDAYRAAQRVGEAA